MLLSSPHFDTGEPGAQSSFSSSMPEGQAMPPALEPLSVITNPSEELRKKPSKQLTTTHLEQLTTTHSKQITKNPSEQPTTNPSGKLEKKIFMWDSPSFSIRVPENLRCKWKEREGAGQWTEEKKNIGQEKLADMWDHILAKLAHFFELLGIRWSNIDVVSVGLGGNWAPIILWIGVPPLTLTRNGSQVAEKCKEILRIAQKCKEILREYKINHVDCQIGEVNRFLIIEADPEIKWPESHGTADLGGFSIPTSWKSKSTEDFLGVHDPKGFYADTDDPSLALTLSNTLSSSNAENEEYMRQRRHLLTLPESAIFQPLSENTEPGATNKIFAGDSDNTNVEFFEGQDLDFEEQGPAPTLDDLSSKQMKIVRFEKLIKMVNSWSTPESRIAGQIKFSLIPHDNIARTIGWYLEEVSPSEITDIPSNIIDCAPHSGDR